MIACPGHILKVQKGLKTLVYRFMATRENAVHKNHNHTLYVCWGKTKDQTYHLRPFCTHWHNNGRRVGAFSAHNTMLWLQWDAGV